MSNIITTKGQTSNEDAHVNVGTEKTIVLDSPVWDDIRIVPTSFDFVGATDPTLVDYNPAGGGLATKLYEFAKNDVAYFVVQIPHNYKEGTDINLHLHWTPRDRGTTESGNTVGWKVGYSWANVNSTFPAIAEADLSSTCDGTNDKHQMSDIVIIDGHTTPKTISSMLICYVTRTDTGSDDTWSSALSGELPLLLEVDFHYQIDTVGSRKAGTK